MWVNVKLFIKGWAFVSTSGPGSEISGSEKGQFRISLNKCMESFGDQYNVVVLGDLNSRVGNLAGEYVVGRYCVPGRSDYVDNLIGLCMELEFLVGNCLFKKQNIHWYTLGMMARGAVLDRTLIFYRFKRVVGLGFSGEGGGMAVHSLVERRLRLDQEWKGTQE